MGSKLRLAVPLLAVVALMTLGATASIAANGKGKGNGQGGGSTPVTICHKPGKNGQTIVVDDNAVPAHLNHGDYLGACVVTPAEDDDGGSQSPGDEAQPPGDEGQNPRDQGQAPGDDTQNPGDDDNSQTPGDEDKGSGSKDDPAPPSFVIPTGSSWTSSESRSLYCSTQGAVDRGNGEHPGVSLNLTESQGALLLAQGLVTPAFFYAGYGATCETLPGYVYAGYWVDHVGNVVPGVAVYPYYLPKAG